MTTKEFIENIANGTFSKNDMLIQSEIFPDKKELLWDLWMADKVCLDSTGKPQIEDDAQITRISNAIDWLSEYFKINIYNETEDTGRANKLLPGINLVNTTRPRDKTFYTGKSDESIIKIYQSLVEFGYISPNTTESQFLAICGRSDFESPIIWIAGVRKLAYFIECLFGSCNLKKWDKTITCFMNKDRKPVKGSLISGLSFIANHGTTSAESSRYFDNYDKTLRKIVNES